MPLILGLDPSLRKAGYVVLDTDKPETHVVERGRLKTKVGVLVQRLIQQATSLETLIKRYDVKFISTEAPYFGGNESEALYAVHMFFHRVYLENNCYVLCIPPQTLKKAVLPDMSVRDIFKTHMTDKAKDLLGPAHKNIAEDEADAYHAGRLGHRYYRWHFNKTLPDTKLTPYELEYFSGKKTYVRGIRRGTSQYTGVIYRPNELYFDYQMINLLTEKLAKKEADERLEKSNQGD